LLRELAPDLWVTERSLTFAGIDVGTRMTVIRLREGELFLHSPVALDPELQRALDALGTVRFAVAPNRMHHLFIGDYCDAYPKAELFAAPGLETKRKDVGWRAVLGDEAPPAWAGQLEQLFFRGFPLANEVVFFHPPSRSLLLTDLAFNIGPDSPPATRFAFRLLRAYERFGPSLLERILIRDRSAGRASLQGILAWDFDRVIMAHGQVLAKGGRDALRAGYAWLL
jgi:hypothetical protein